MHEINNIKVINTQHAVLIHQYNIKQKLFKTYAVVWLDKICRIGQHYKKKPEFVDQAKQYASFVYNNYNIQQ